MARKEGVGGQARMNESRGKNPVQKKKERVVHPNTNFACLVLLGRNSHRIELSLRSYRQPRSSPRWRPFPGRSGALRDSSAWAVATDTKSSAHGVTRPHSLCLAPTS